MFYSRAFGCGFFLLVLANSTKMCYTYDNLSRVTARTVKKLSDNSVISTETFNYDAAGNITDAPDSCFRYLDLKLNINLSDQTSPDLVPVP